MKKVKTNKLGRRILSFVLTVALMVGLMPGNILTVSAEGTDTVISDELIVESVSSNDATSTTECTCETDDPAFHATNCPAYIAPENPQCFCAEKCTDDTLNVWCDVCGVQGVSACQGTDTAKITYEGVTASVTYTITRAFEVTGGVLYTDYAYAGDVLTIYTSTPLTIKNTTPSTPTTDRIEVALGISANITLAGVNIDVSSQSNTAAFKIADNSTGNVTITLADGTTNTLKSGDNCAGLQKNGEYSETLGKLTITGTGTLTATGSNYGAGIGGGKSGSGSNIEISGGTVEAQGGTGIGGGWSGSGSYFTISGGEVTAIGNIGAGIGGGPGGSGSNIEISGGTVTATGGHEGAGIGGGSGGSGSNIEISGGTVTATGGESGAGIGGGNSGSGSYITISGGKVTATSVAYGAGIGGGFEANGSNITISGGVVIANGGGGSNGGAGIGGGAGSSGSYIEISGGTVTATGGTGGAGIGGGADGSADNIKISGGSVKAVAGEGIEDEGTTYFPAAIGQGVQNDGVCSNGAEVTPTDGNGNNVYLLELDVDGTSAVTINGKAYPKKHFDENKVYVYLPAGEHTIVKDGGAGTTAYYAKNADNKLEAVAIGTAFTITGTDLVYGTDYTYADGVLTILSPKAVTIANADPSTSTTNRIEVADGVPANITLAGVNIDVSSQSDTAAFKIADNSAGNVTITLADGTTNTLKSGKYCAGLQKNGAYISETQGKLTITGTGSLTATGGTDGAGIGGGNGGNGSYIEISGGEVTATGGEYGAGIGGGDSYDVQAVGCNIKISGGTVTATGGEGGAGIGGGYKGSGSNIEISGGVVTATGGYSGAGIGGGFDGSTDNITISGGSVKAVAGTVYQNCVPAAIGQGVQYDGVYSNGAEVTPTDGNGNNVYLLELDVDGTSAVTANGKAYPTKHIDKNKLYVYLPAGNYTVANGNSQKIYTIADDGTVSEVDTTFTITGTDLVYGTDYTYPADTGVLTILSGKAMTIANVNPNTATTNTIVVADGVSANITLAGVNIDVSLQNGTAAFKIADDSTGNVTITLADGSTNTLKSGNNRAGLQKNGAYISETQGKLTITGTGSLTATGGVFGAGIGGGAGSSGSNIEISGGTVTAIGGDYGAGIGGGDSEGVQAVGCNIKISGGTVTAEGGAGGAGIGGGFYGSGSNITISGGTITAIGGESGAGIGGGYDGGSGSNIKISGGSVKAVAGTVYQNCVPAAIGQGVQYDGVHSNGAEVTPTDGTDNVYLLELDVDGTSAVTINGKAYPKKHFDENKLYVYLPAKTAQAPNEVTVGNETTNYCYINAKWLKVVDSPEADDTEFTYDGTEKTYTFAGSDYCTITGNKQTNAGTYTVTVALNDKVNTVWSDDGTTDDKTYEFVINKATPTAKMFTYTAPTDLDYDGNVKSATVTTDKDGMGEITIQYYKNGILTETVECGIYSVKVSVAEGDNYTDATDLTADDWTFTINHVDADNNGYCDGCGAIYDGIGAHLAGYSVSLNGSIGVNFHMDLTQDVLDDNEAYMLFTLPNGTSQKVMVSDAKAKESTIIEGKTYYIFTCNVAAKEMTDTIQAQLITSDGSKTQVYEYSVREYADRILSGSYDAETKELVKAMLHYGAYSQEWFGYNTTNPANAGLDPLDLLEAADDWDEFNPSISNNDKVGSFTSAYLTLESDTAINLKFKLADGVSFEDLRVVVEDPLGNVVPVTTDTTENVCLITLTGIKASDLDTTYDFSVTDKEGNESAILYSAMSYACAVANSEMDQKLKNVTAALRIFNLRANEKFEY